MSAAHGVKGAKSLGALARLRLTRGGLARREAAGRFDEADELRAASAQIRPRRGARELGRVLVGRLPLVARVAQEQAELRDRGGELEVVRGVAVARLTVGHADAQGSARGAPPPP